MPSRSAALAATIAREKAGGIVTVFLDCDSEGENGMKQCLGYLADIEPGIVLSGKATNRFDRRRKFRHFGVNLRRRIDWVRFGSNA